MGTNSPVLEIWRFSTSTPRQAVILPDGCRDLIFRSDITGQRQDLVLSDLDSSTRTVELAAGEHLAGLRLRAGATIPGHVVRELRRELARSPADEDPTQLLVQAAEAYAELNDDLVDALASASSVMSAARRLGVSERTLHRHVHSRTGKAPSFWIDLARARRALRALPSDLSLAEIALDAGYADQAHLTRALRTRFGSPPAKLRKDHRLMRLAARPGFSG